VSPQPRPHGDPGHSRRSYPAAADARSSCSGVSGDRWNIVSSVCPPPATWLRRPTPVGVLRFSDGPSRSARGGMGAVADDRAGTDVVAVVPGSPLFPPPSPGSRGVAGVCRLAIGPAGREATAGAPAAMSREARVAVSGAAEPGLHPAQPQLAEPVHAGRQLVGPQPGPSTAATSRLARMAPTRAVSAGSGSAGPGWRVPVDRLGGGNGRRRGPFLLQVTRLCGMAALQAPCALPLVLAAESITLRTMITRRTPIAHPRDFTPTEQ